MLWHCSVNISRLFCIASRGLRMNSMVLVRFHSGFSLTGIDDSDRPLVGWKHCLYIQHRPQLYDMARIFELTQIALALLGPMTTSAGSR
jgi:hypothetical protein